MHEGSLLDCGPSTPAAEGSVKVNYELANWYLDAKIHNYKLL